MCCGRVGNLSTYFYPRSPCGERRYILYRVKQGFDFYPRSPCGERQKCCTRQARIAAISIHALLAESDYLHSNTVRCGAVFLSTLSLRRATKQGRHYIGCKIFLSTLSLRRATVVAIHNTDRPLNFYPRSPCGERRTQRTYKVSTVDFYPRSPCGERLIARVSYGTGIFISIHALLAESDRALYALGVCPFISIHALLAESDASRADITSAAKYFYPRSPCGERPDAQHGNFGPRPISIHALLAESDLRA